MVIASLSLDDVLENSPQTQCLLKMFEEDTCALSAFASQFQTHLELFVSAQSDVAASLEQMATFLSSYETVQFPLQRNSEEFGDTVKKFQGTIAELGNWIELMVQQMQNCVVYPVNKLLDRLNECRRAKEGYYENCQSLNLSVMKLHRLSRKEPTKKVEDVNAEYGACRRHFHKAGLRYFIVLNSLQYQRRIALIEPLLSIIYAYRSLFRMGDQSLSQGEDLPQFFTRVQEQIQSFHVEQQLDATNSQEYLQSMEEIARIQPQFYTIDGGESAESIDERLRHKQGYLFFKSRSGLLNKWEQYYFYTENNSFLYQGKDEIGSQILIDLNESVHAVEADQEDRRFCFLVICSDQSRQFCFQAISARDCKEWITAINNIVSDSVRIASATRAESEQLQEPPIVPQQQEESFAPEASEDEFSSAPIQFDLFEPVEENCLANGLAVCEEASERADEYSAKFLGCVEVSTDRQEATIRNAIRRVIRARMTHNIVRAVDAKFFLVKRPPELRLVEPSGCTLKAAFPMEQIVHWTADQSNERIFAFIVRQRNDQTDGHRNQYMCHVFESTGTETAEEICNILGDAVKSALQIMS